MKCKILTLAVELSGLARATIHATIPAAEIEQLPKRGKRLTLEIKEERKGRSLNANSYCWKLCDELARVLGTTKEAVYRLAIAQVGVWGDLRMKRFAYPRFAAEWAAKGTGKGTGFFTEVIEFWDDWCTVRYYYGSHTYDVPEMSRLIDFLVDEAERQGIDTMTPLDRARMLDEWGDEWGKRHGKTLDHHR